MFGGPMRDTVASAHSLTPHCVPPSHATYGRLTVLLLNRNGSAVHRNVLCKYSDGFLET